MEEQTNEVQEKSGSKPWLGIIAVVVIVAIAGFAYKQSQTQKPETLGASDKQTAKVANAPTRIPYKDGTFTAEGDYMTHVGQKHISVKITLKNEVITDAQVTDEADDPMSKQFQEAFIGGYKQFVVGKKIDEVKVSKVASSSLTPTGFNNALDAIKKQAQAQS